MTDDVLLVETDSQVVERVKSALLFKGYRVTVSASGMEALHLHNNSAFGLLLVDELLPDMSGFRFLELLHRSLQRTPRPAVIMLIKGSDRSFSEDYTPDRYLIRAFQAQELLVLIRQLGKKFVAKNETDCVSERFCKGAP